ncbi:MAG: nucleotidyl transferase AbiEii/AbiGii toxin family protein, partial [Pseudomonadota bacterium]|nr:nucleotidyl transferase AbiEii/AbiGii toxin family protein [Pseudomonadota bacterium]
QYAGKFCAALDRQHPRDLFDVMLFFETHTITEALKKAFLVYLICGNRPISEIIHPNLIDQRVLYAEQFQGMVENGPSYEELDFARTKLIQAIDQCLNDDDRSFLLSVKKGEPDWGLLGIPNVERLPGVIWKLMNIQRMTPERRHLALQVLESKLA